MNDKGPDLSEIYSYSSWHRINMNHSTNCGCFNCCSMHNAHKIAHWIHDGQTALCPKCEKPTLLPDSLVPNLSYVLLTLMYNEYRKPKEKPVSTLEEKAEKFTALGTSIGSILAAKNKSYGDSFAESVKVIEALFPSGIPKSAYPQLLTIIRMVDKLFRIATISQDPKYSFSEGEVDAWQDLAGYSILALERVTRSAAPEAKTEQQYRDSLSEND